VIINSNMNQHNCPSHVDTEYYQKKYSLRFDNKKDAIGHYIKIGKQKGYFPNRHMEIYYCQAMNFDPEYYKRKYNISGNNHEVQRHWKLYGSKQGYYVNQCEELGEHASFMCKCRIVNKKADKRPLDEYRTYADQLTDHDSTHDSTNDSETYNKYKDSDKDDFVFSEKQHIFKHKSKQSGFGAVSKRRDSSSNDYENDSSSKISSSCPSRPELDIKISQSN